MNKTVMFDYFDNYGKKYPEVVVEILEYFSIQTNKPISIKDKTITNFCKQHKVKNKYIYQPQIISRICKRLCDYGMMECIRPSGILGFDSNYLFNSLKNDFFQKNREHLKFYFNSIVYGFNYIYEMYKPLVIPLVWETGNGNYAAGTGFKIYNGIVTAKHCITDVKNLSIKGFKAEDLEDKPVYISDNEKIDIAYIETGIPTEPLLLIEEGQVMQEILVMGYPNIPTFTEFLTVEKGTISSKASTRITPTRGNIAAYGQSYIAKIEAMLITAKIRGGNSGGPVINQNGSLVGIACQMPDYNNSEGTYDDLGYGIAVPSKYLKEIIKNKSKKIDIPSSFYRNFEE